MTLLKIIKQYQRPLRTVLWAVLLAIRYIGCSFFEAPCNDDLITQIITVGFFADMGIYTVSRTLEKIKSKNLL